MIIDGNKLTPSEGYKYITNGETWSDLVFLGIYDSADNWHDTNDEPPEPEPMPEDAEATAEDYEAALAEVGI